MTRFKCQIFGVGGVIRSQEMIYYTTEFWELVLDVIALFLCGGVLLHLIRNRAKYNQSLLKEPEKENPNNFNEEVAAQLMKQQSERSFETISNAIEKERMLLHKLNPLAAEEPVKVQDDLYTKNSYNKNSYNENNTDNSNLAGDKYDEVSRLADLGFSAKKISERTKIPMGEAELIVKLKGLES